jgi:HK97 family phage major capsid protein
MKRLDAVDKLPKLTREMRLEIAPAAVPVVAGNDAKPDEDRFDISISSETQVPRWFGAEVLDHSVDAVDLERARSGGGLAFLADHDTGDQVGLVESLTVSDRKLRGVVRFSRSARAQEIKRDVVDGIRPFISVGYRVQDMKLESSSEDSGDVYRVTKWTPMEVSSVSVPADYTVGVGRDAEEFPVQVRSNSETAALPPIQTPEVRAMDAKKMAEIVRLGKVHKIDQERVAKWIEDERTVEAVSAEILAGIASRAGAQPITQPPAERTELVLTEKEQQQYSLCRAILAMADAAEGHTVPNSFELELSREIEKRLPKGIKGHGGLFVPYSLTIDPEAVRRATEMYRAGLDTQTTTKGKEVVFTEPGPFIEFLYNRMVVKALGAQTLSGLQGNLAFPKQTGKATGSWVAENPGTDVADSNLLLGQILMSPHTYQSSSSYSRQLLAQSVIDIDNLVRNDLATDSALAIDKAALVGDGTGNSPKGIISTTGTQHYALSGDAGNGAKPVYTDILGMERMIEDANADILGDYGWVTVPGIKALLRNTARLSNTIGWPVWEAPEEMDGYRAMITNQLPKNLTEGTGTALTYLILGIWTQLMIGMWGAGYELVVDPYRLKKQGMIELTTFVMADIGIRQPPAFVYANTCIMA